MHGAELLEDMQMAKQWVDGTHSGADGRAPAPVMKELDLATQLCGQLNTLPEAFDDGFVPLAFQVGSMQFLPDDIRDKSRASILLLCTVVRISIELHIISSGASAAGSKLSGAGWL